MLRITRDTDDDGRAKSEGHQTRRWREFFSSFLSFFLSFFLSLLLLLFCSSEKAMSMSYIAAAFE
jgi:hypothetical protein